MPPSDQFAFIKRKPTLVAWKHTCTLALLNRAVGTLGAGGQSHHKIFAEIGTKSSPSKGLELLLAHSPDFQTFLRPCFRGHEKKAFLLLQPTTLPFFSCKGKLVGKDTLCWRAIIIGDNSLSYQGEYRGVTKGKTTVTKVIPKFSLVFLLGTPLKLPLVWNGIVSYNNGTSAQCPKWSTTLITAMQWCAGNVYLSVLPNAKR